MPLVPIVVTLLFWPFHLAKPAKLAELVLSSVLRDVALGVGVITKVVDVGIGIKVGVDVDVGVMVDVDVGVMVDVGVATGINVDIGVRVDVDAGINVDVEVRVNVGVGVDVDVKVGVNVGIKADWEGVIDGVFVGLGVKITKVGVIIGIEFILAPISDLEELTPIFFQLHIKYWLSPKPAWLGSAYNWKTGLLPWSAYTIVKSLQFLILVKWLLSDIVWIYPSGLSILGGGLIHFL